MAEQEECPKCPPEGLPAWMGTFADLMSLLMCFFVLLLAFSEMDVLKFKQIAGSMKFAFGVQNKIEVKDIPKGTSVIAMEFRPGRPDPTPIETIQQQTIEMTQQMLEFQAGDEDSAGGRQKQRGTQRGGQAQQASLPRIQVDAANVMPQFVALCRRHKRSAAQACIAPTKPTTTSVCHNYSTSSTIIIRLKKDLHYNRKCAVQRRFCDAYACCKHRCIY